MLGWLSKLLGNDSPERKRFRRRELKLAAMENLWPMPRRSELFPVSDAQLAQDERWVEQKRAWVREQNDPSIREAYEGWLQWVEQGIARNREENRTGNHKRELDARWTGYQKEMESARGVAKIIPSPPR